MLSSCALFASQSCCTGNDNLAREIHRSRYVNQKSITKAHAIANSFDESVNKQTIFALNVLHFKFQSLKLHKNEKQLERCKCMHKTAD